MNEDTRPGPLEGLAEVAAGSGRATGYAWVERSERARRGRRLALLSYLVVALVGAMIGGLVVATVAQQFWADGGSSATQQLGAVALPGSPAGTPASVSTKTPAEYGTVTYAAENVGPAVVGILAKSTAYDRFRRAYTAESSGSGVIFHQDGYIVTNNHVVEGAYELLVSLADGRVLSGRLVGADAFTDLAVVKIEAEDLPVAVFGDSDLLRVGEVAIAIGNPLG